MKREYSGEYTDCGCGIFLCKRYFVFYKDMSYNKLLFLATQKGLIKWREKPVLLDVINILINNNIKNSNQILKK